MSVNSDAGHVSRRVILASMAAPALGAATTTEARSALPASAAQPRLPAADTYRRIYRETFSVLREVESHMRRLVGDALCRAGRGELTAEDALWLWDIAAGPKRWISGASRSEARRARGFAYRGFVTLEIDRWRLAPSLTSSGQEIVAIIDRALFRHGGLLAYFGPELAELEVAPRTLRELSVQWNDIVRYRL